MEKFKKPRIFTGSLQAVRFLRTMGLKPWIFFLPAFLALIASGFEGLMVAMLIPFVKGAMTMDFGFVKTLSYLEGFLGLFGNHKEQDAFIFFLLIVIIVSASIFKNVFIYTSRLLVSFHVRKFSDHVRKSIFSRYLTFGKLYFDRVNTGQLIQTLMGHTTRVATSLEQQNQLLTAVFMVIVYFVMMFRISWKLTLFASLAIPILNFFSSRLISKIKKSSEQYVLSQARINNNIFNILSCMNLVRISSQEENENKKFDALSAGLRKTEFSIDKKTNLILPLQDTIGTIMLFILITAIAFLMMKQSSGNLAEYLVYFYIVRRVLNSMGTINSMKGSFASVTGSIDVILSVFDDDDKFYIEEGDKECPELKKEIRFSKLNFDFGSSPVLKDLTCEFKRGQMTAIVGPSGAGKTTIINLIMRFYDCPKGSIFFDGTDIREFRLRSLRTKIALVSQEAYLFNDTLKNNILFGLEGDVPENTLRDALKRARLYDFVHSLPKGLETLIGDRGVQLSGGEKQRVSIARAILKQPEILILDEATSALDSETEKLVQEAIQEVIHDKTAIVIAHRLSTIKNANKIIVIENGKLVEQGSLDELLQKKEKFYNYWENQRF